MNVGSTMRRLMLIAGLCLTLPLAAQGVIGVAKDASVGGRVVTMTFTIENLGPDTLTAISLPDDLDAAFGAGNYTVTSGPSLVINPGGVSVNGSFDGSGTQELLGASALDPGELARIEIQVNIDMPVDLGSGLGVYSNQVTATATDSMPAMVSDLSDDGTDPDPNGNGDPTDAGEDDPTSISLFENPQIGVAKNAMVSGNMITLDFYLENFGNVTLSNLSLPDELDAVFGAGNYSVVSGPSLIDDPGTITVNGGFDGSAATELITSGTLAVADTAQLRVVVNVDTVSDQGAGFGVYSNQVTASGQAPGGNVDVDDSDYGTNPDPDGDNNPSGTNEADPTLFVIGEEPSVGVAKSAAVNGSVVTLDLYLENLGNVTLSDLSLFDDLNSTFGAGNFYVSSAPSLIVDPGGVMLNGGFDGFSDMELLGVSTLASGALAQIQLQVTVLTLSDEGLGLGVYENQAVAFGRAPGGGTTQDLSDDGTDPDPNGNGFAGDGGEDDPTAFTVAAIASIGVAKQYILESVTGGVPLIALRFRVTNYGNQTINNITITDDLNAVYGAGNFSHFQDPTLVTGSATLSYNLSFNGNTDTAMLSGGSLDPGESTLFEIKHNLVNITDQGFGAGIYQNQVTVSGTDPLANPVSDISHEGSDPDGNSDGDPSNDADPTVIDVTQSAALGIATDVSLTGNLVTLDVYLENLGQAGINDIFITQSLDMVFGSGNYSFNSAPMMIMDPGTLVLNGAFGPGDNQLLGAGSSLAAGTLAQIRFIVSVDNVANQGLGLGNYSAQPTVSGFSSLSQPVSDTSDFGTDPDPNGNGDPDEAGENDATTFSLGVDSPVGVAKQAAVAGNAVTVDLYLENLGPSTVTSVGLTDSLDTTFGAGNYTITSAPAFIVDPGTLSLNGAYDGGADAAILAAGGTLNGGATAQIQLQVTVDTESDQGGGFGVYSNQAVANCTQPSGVVVSDDSDDGTDPDPNGNSDPGEAGEEDATPIIIIGTPVIGISKQAYVNGTVVTFDFYVENLGDSTVTNVLMKDPLNPVFGSSNYSIASQPSLVSGPGTLTLSPQFFGFSVFDFIVTGGSLRPGEVSHFRTVINVTNVTDQGNGLGVFHNQVTVTATDPAGNALMDVSDSGIDPDPNGNGDPTEAGEEDLTVITIGDENRMGVALDVAVTGQQVTFDYYLENFSGNAINSLLLPHDLDGIFGAGNYSINTAPAFISDPGTIVLNGGFDGSGDTAIFAGGSNLPAVGSGQIQLIVDVTNVTDRGLGFGAYQSQVTLTGTSPLGAAASDISDFGTDPDPNGNGVANDSGEEDVTTFSVGTQIIGVAKNATVVDSTVTLDYYVENLGTVAITTVSLPDDLDTVFGAGNYSITSGPEIVGPPRLFVPNTNFDGSSDTELISSGGLGLGVTEQIQVVVEITNLADLGGGLGVFTNQVTVTGDMVSDLSDDGTDPDPNGNSDPTEAGENDATAIVVGQYPVVGIAKTVGVSSATLTIDFFLEAFGNTPVTNLDLNEDLDTLLGAGNYTVTGAPSFIDDPGTITLNAGFDGSSDMAVFDPGSSLNNGDTAQVRITVAVGLVIDGGGGLGNYSNQVTLSGQSADATATSDTSDSGTNPDPDGDRIPDEAGENDATTFTITSGTIGDFVFNDLDGNGSLDGGESGFSGITVFADFNSNGTQDAGEPGDTTDGTGAYDIVGLVAGTYDIRAVVPMGFVLTAGTNPVSITLTTGGDDNTADFGFQQQDASIGDLVWEDLDGDGMLDGGEPGISGVTVFLDLNSNGTLDGGEPSDTTDGSGNYDLTDLATGTYQVTVDAATLPAGFVLTGGTEPLTEMLAAGEDFNDADFGYQQQDATIGDLVWDDLDGDGTADMGEPGISGVTVFLDDNLNGTFDMGESSETTDMDGLYDFTGLAAGTYSVRIDTATLPMGYAITGGTNPQSVTIVAGEDYNDADFGYQQQDATIGDLVFNDLDGNGVFGGGEPGLSGVTVFLDANLNGMLDGGETSATTDGAGAYDLSGLPLGTYSVRVDGTTLPAGFVLTSGTNPHSATIVAGEDYNLADFGFQQQNASIGDLLWDDLDGDGMVDGGEPGLTAVTVFLDANLNGVLDGGESSQMTDGAGNYDFMGLPVGTYSVMVDTSTLPMGYVQTAGTNPQSVTIAAGEDFNTADFGYQQQNATIGDFVWNDLDGDGVQDGGEPGFSGVTVFLDSNLNGMLDGGESSLMSDGGGAYDFTGLPAGTYSVVVDISTLPAGFVLTGGANPRSVTIVAGEDFNGADFGYQQQNASIGDLVWDDLDGDGVIDGGEPGLDGITVFLDSNLNGVLDGGETSEVTAGGGLYDFTGLPAGTYSVMVVIGGLPAGYVQTAGANPQSVTIVAGEDRNTADFGYQQQNATIGDFVWDDLNGDGVQDGGEPGLVGVTVFLDANLNGVLDGGETSQMTDGTGAYDFTGLPLGTYSVMLDISGLPAGYAQTAGANPQSVTIVAGEDFNTADFGYQQQNATIGDFVWNDLDGDGVQDGGEPGLSGVTVFLDGNLNGVLDGGESSLATDGGGAFDFTGLPLGTYSVMVDVSTLPMGFVLTGGTNPVSVTLVAGQDYNSADFGYQQQNATIGDFVWNDLNGDGVQDGGESGIAGVTVFLDANLNGMLDGGETSVTTDGAGAYDFTALAVGTYSVMVDAATVTSGFVQTGGTNPVSVTLAAGEDHNGADFGYQQQDATIGDFVWNDLNGDGVQDGGEAGLSGVTVFLDSNGNGVLDGGESSLATDGAGAYDFTNLATGTYLVRIDESTVTTGFVLTGGTNPLTVNLAAGEDFNTADFGYQQQDASIGDFVWNDLNGDGVQDGGEPGLAGVTVFLDSNGNGVLDGGETSLATDGAGAYDFTNLATDTYAVRVDESTVTSGFVLTGGVNPTAVNLAAGEDFNGADFGYQQQDATIGDFVWNDLNGDGVQDAGEPGLAAVTVYLDSNSNGVLDGGEPTQITDANGAYDFTNLATGTYLVRIDGSTVTTGFVLTGGTIPVTVNLAAGEDFNTADFGYQQQDAAIGDFVWNDLNGDGVQDGGEPGLAAVTVFLDSNGNGVLDGGESSLATDGAGAYDFTGLATGTYSVRVDESTVTTGFVLTGGANPLTVNLAAGEDFNTADFGYQQQDATIGDFVWDDLNGDGVQDGGEPGIVGVTVFLDSNGNGTLDGGETSVATIAGGAYDFTALALGTYAVRVDTTTLATGMVQTGGSNPQSVTIAAGEDFNDADFGFQLQSATIGDFVWNDLNGDGVQDAGEPGLVGITLFIDSNSNGSLDGGEPSQVTGAGGAYDFTALPLGTYSVMVDESTIPAGGVRTGGSNPRSVTIAAGEDHNDADFGYQVQNGTIGDFIWDDLNGDGVQDAGEPGLAGITAYLDLNNNAAQDPGEPNATSDGSGAYDITSLAPGTYVLRVNTSTVPTGYLLTTAIPPITINLATSEDYNTADFGYRRGDGTIGDFVWNDLNADGVQDAGEPGLGNVTVFADLNNNGTREPSEPVRTTDAAGAYDLRNLAAGTYSIVVLTPPTGMVLTTSNEPLSVTLSAGEDYNDADFGYSLPGGSIGDLVFEDLDGNGLHTSNEPGLANVTIEVVADTNKNGYFDIGEKLLATTTTDTNGNYQVSGLVAGTYLVNVTDTNGELAGFELTAGSEPLQVVLTQGDDITDADFGYSRQDNSVGDLVWGDGTNDGTKDTNELGIANVTLDLIWDLNQNAQADPGEPVRDTLTTDANGAYRFSNLPAGYFIIEVTDTNGVLTNHQLTTGNEPMVVNLVGGHDRDDADFGYCEPPSITVQPMSQLVCNGDSVTLSVTVSGSEPLSFGWLENNIFPVSADRIIVVTATTISTFYTATITNGCGTVTSNQATVEGVPLSLRFDPAVVVQGNVPVTLEAIIECDQGPLVIDWKDLTNGGSFGAGMNPVTLPGLLSQTSTIRCGIRDAINPAVAANVDVQVLVAQDPRFWDLNGDTCNTIEDVQWLAPDWLSEQSDANGDNFIDILDFIYIRVDNDCDE